MTENTLFNVSDVFVLDGQYIEKLKTIAGEHPLRRARVCLHQDRSSSVQEMIIIAHRDSVFEVHRHPEGKAESYHVVEGSLLVKLFDDGGKQTREIHLDGDAPPKVYRINGGIWHQPIPLSEWVVYHEVFQGPFVKHEDVIYANW